ncbi:enterochelin esterase [Ktedonospora formicarum]|uniref:Enterochelin esterase N-terminal domain-containing protein n=1 Tax=Ktedonospora formicarum TaxID=2778364 RepID=A0A8J3I8H1_9CHLR|nr:enterochelin esterase [Ktedonospora formicarum]GHO49148.1 hypothetical protein KSX_73110 [Ktedonospora formicarum]
MTADPSLLSPRLAQLQQELEEGSSYALQSFWEEVTKQGTPLIEPLPNDSLHSLVTFLWKDAGNTQNVVLIGGPTRWGEFTHNQLQHVPHTDLWFKTYRLRSDMCTTYRLSPNDALTGLKETKDWKARTATFQLDPLNPQIFVYPKDEDIADDEEYQASILTLPQAPRHYWRQRRHGIAKGTVEMHRFRSALLANERRIWVYTPPGYTASSTPYGVLLLLDGFCYLHVIPTPTILDNLLSEKQIPPLITVFIDSLDAQTRLHEMRCNPTFVHFLRQELLPWLRERYHVTSDSARTTIGGVSAGGLAAAFVAFQAADLFGNILSQSGSFWWGPEKEEEWLTTQYAASEKRPLRFALEVGLLERATTVDQVVVNRRLRDVLRTKGYDVHYAEYNGGHDYLTWRESMADRLLALMGKSLSGK